MITWARFFAGIRAEESQALEESSVAVISAARIAGCTSTCSRVSQPDGQS